MKVRIICGSYGYRTKYGVKPVMLGETCEVDGMEAGRLVGLGIAEIVDAPASPSAAAPAQAAAEQEYNDTPAEENAAEKPAAAHLVPEDLADMTVANLKKMAADMGIDTKALKTKDALIQAICAEEVYPGEPMDGPDPTVVYDGATYEDIPVVIPGLHDKARRQLQSDHAQGLYLVSRVMHCTLDDLGGNQPEKGCRIRINEREGGSFFHDYYVASSICEMGMLRVELEDVDE